MTTQQAKQILLAYRPWADDAQDPQVVQALALCEQDAELKTWFENHCVAQIATRDHLRLLPVPDGLRQQILSEYKSHTSPAWRRPAILATVATAVLLIAATSIWFSIPQQSGQDTSFAAYRSRMVRNVARIYGMPFETNDTAQIRAYLAQNQAPADYVLPKTLAQIPQVGCGTLSWQGKPVSMVCFRTGKPLPPSAKSDLFLFVIEQKDVIAPPQLDVPVFAKVNVLATVSWAEGGKIYVLATADESDLKRHL